MGAAGAEDVRARSATSASHQGTPTATQKAGSRPLEVTPAVTRSKASPGSLLAMLFDNILRGMQKLLYTKDAKVKLVYYIEMLTYAEYAYDTTSVQLKGRSEGEKVVGIPSTYKEVMGLPEAALWKAASDNEMAFLGQDHVYDLVLLTSFPTGKKSIGSRGVSSVAAFTVVTEVN